MENASRALVMVGAVLIAILIMSLLVYFFTQPGKMYSSINEKKEAKILQNFNKQYESFNRNNLYGVDIISAMNKVLDNNKQNEGYNNLQIEMQVTIKSNSNPNKDVLHFLHPPGSNRTYLYAWQLEEVLIGKNNGSNDFTQGSVTDDIRTFKTAKFRCIGIEYSPTTSRVTLLRFEQSF